MTRIRPALLLVLILAALAAAFLFARRPGPARSPAQPVPLETAFLNARWGMSRAQIEKANRSALTPTPDYRRFYTPKSEISKSKLAGFQCSGILFLNRDATVIYLFRDGRLFSYHVFVRDADADRLDADARAYLEREYGPDFDAVDDESSLKMVWQTKKFIVNYWLFQEEFSLSQKFTAGYGVIYRPLEEGQLSLKEVKH